MDDDSKLARLVTYNTYEMLKELNNLICPVKFCRILSAEEFSYFFTTNTKDKLLNLHALNQDNKSM